jgi:hypothetical protein
LGGLAFGRDDHFGEARSLDRVIVPGRASLPKHSSLKATPVPH